MPRLSITVSPGAKTGEIVGRHGDGWKLRVAAQAERGRANDAGLGLLAQALAVSRSELELASGWGSRRKTVEVRGLTAAEIEARLSARAAR